MVVGLAVVMVLLSAAAVHPDTGKCTEQSDC